MNVETKNGLKEAPANKWCPWCGEYKTTKDHFPLYTDTYDGFRQHCNACEKKRKKREEAAARDLAIEIYGGECVKCGQPDTADSPLQLDHVHNGGKAHREVEAIPTMRRRIAKTGAPITDYLNKLGESVPIQLQLLCKSCHDAKTEADFPGYLDYLYSKNRKDKAVA